MGKRFNPCLCFGERQLQFLLPRIRHSPGFPRRGLTPATECDLITGGRELPADGRELARQRFLFVECLLQFTLPGFRGSRAFHGVGLHGLFV